MQSGYFIMLYTLQWRGTHNRVRLQLKCDLESWNLEMLVFQERGKPEYPEKHLSEQGQEPTTNSTQIWCRVRESTVDNRHIMVEVLRGRQMHNHCARGTVMTILLLSRQSCGEILTQEHCSKQETLLE